jgi:hypothetical protein
MPETVLAARSREFAQYREAIARVLEPSDLVVDFNAPEYSGLRSDDRNFNDAAHLSHAGARAVAATLGRIISERGEMTKTAGAR